jgi:hypothetical protein
LADETDAAFAAPAGVRAASTDVLTALGDTAALCRTATPTTT